MKTINFFLVCLLLVFPNINQAQISIPGNLGGFGDYLGWDATMTSNLQIRHDANQPIIFSTNNLERMRVHGNTAIGTSTVSSVAELFVFQDQDKMGIKGTNYNANLTLQYLNFWALKVNTKKGLNQNIGV